MAERLSLSDELRMLRDLKARAVAHSVRGENA